MVSLRRRRLLGLCSGNNSLATQLPLYENSSKNANSKSGQSVIKDIPIILDNNTVAIDESGSSNVSRSSPSKEQPSQQNRGTMSSMQEILNKASKRSYGKVTRRREVQAAHTLPVGVVGSSSQAIPQVALAVDREYVIDVDEQPLKRKKVDQAGKGKSQGEVQDEGGVINTSEGPLLKLMSFCISPDRFGSKTTFCLSDTELRIIEDLGPAGRSQVMTEGIVRVVKALGVAIALNNATTEDKVRAEALLKEKSELVTKVGKLEADFKAYKDEHKVQVGLKAELTEKNQRIKSLEEKAKDDLRIITELRDGAKSFDAVGVVGSSSQAIPQVALAVDREDVIDVDEQPLKRKKVDQAGKGKSQGEMQDEGGVISTSEGPLLKLLSFCISPDRLGSKTTFCLSDTELRIIEDLGPVGRSQAMTEGIVRAVKALGVAIALNNATAEDKVRAEGLLKEKSELVTKVGKLEYDFKAYKDEHKVQVGLKAELTEKNQRIKSLEEKAKDDLRIITELRDGAKSFDAEKKKIEDALKVVTVRGEDERADLVNLDRAGLIARIAELEKFLVKSARHGFANAINQVKAVNPGVKLVTNGIHYLKHVEAGVVVTPDDFEEELEDDDQA